MKSVNRLKRKMQKKNHLIGLNKPENKLMETQISCFLKTLIEEIIFNKANLNYIKASFLNKTNQCSKIINYRSTCIIDMAHGEKKKKANMIASNKFLFFFSTEKINGFDVFIWNKYIFLLDVFATSQIYCLHTGGSSDLGFALCP